MWFQPKQQPTSMTGDVDEPWLTREFIEIFKLWDTKDWRMFEWGSGSSTYWFSGRVKSLISMDNNPNWHNFVKDVLQKASIQNVTCYLKTLNDMKYYDTILDYEPFDCILIDGRNRVFCIEHAVKRIKSGGVIILDNAEREKYKPAFSTLQAGEHHSTANGMWRTDYWIL